MILPTNVKNDNRQADTNGKMIKPPSWYRQQNDMTLLMLIDKTRGIDKLLITFKYSDGDMIFVKKF